MTATDARGASGTAASPAVAVAASNGTGGLDAALRGALALDSSEAVCQLVVAAADDSAADEAVFGDLLAALDDARALADATPESVLQFAAALRAPTASAAGTAPLSAAAAGAALAQARNLSRDLEATSRASDSGGLDATAAADLAAVLGDVLDSDAFAAPGGARRRLGSSASAAALEASVDDVARSLVNSAVAGEAARRADAPSLAVVGARGAAGSTVVVAARGATAATSAPGDFDALLSAFAVDPHGDGALVATSASTVRFERPAVAGGRRLAESAPGNVTLRLPGNNATLSAGRSANVTLSCPWNYAGVVFGVCPYDNSTVNATCDRVKEEKVVVCGEAYVDACVGWDGDAWSAEGCATVAGDDGGVACVCDVGEEAADYATAEQVEAGAGQE